MTTHTVADYLSRINKKAENTLSMMIKNTSLVSSNPKDKTELRNVLSEIMELNPLFYALYMGYENGDYFQVINLDSTADIRQRFQAEENDRWVVIYIYDNGDKLKIQKTSYYDNKFNLRINEVKKTRYDSRAQPWFKQATSKQVFKTKPYLFTHLQLPGQTYSIKTADQKNVLALGVTLNSVSDYLFQQQAKLADISSAQLLIYNREGEVIASNQQKKQKQLPKLNKLALTAQQQQILARYSTITISNETNWAPIDFSVGGTPRGLTNPQNVTSTATYDLM
jgi:hypothetical protein